MDRHVLATGTTRGIVFETAGVGVTTVITGQTIAVAGGEI